MRIQDNLLLKTAMAWDLERPSEFPRLCNNHSDAMNVASVIAVTCTARGGMHVRSSNQVEHRS